MPENSVVAIRPVRKNSILEALIGVYQAIDGPSIIPRNSHVVVKVNFCAVDTDRLYSNTSISFVEASCRLLLDLGHRVTVGESDGMRDSAEKAFEVMGMYELAKRLGLKVVNFSRDKWIDKPHPILKKWPIPATIADSDAFVSLPILKTHPRTVLTGALKNQWGCVPRFDRVLWHKYLSRLILDINKEIKPKLALMDGIVGMEGRGPCNGHLRRLDLVLGSKDLLALDATSCRLVGLDPNGSKLFLLAEKEGFGVLSNSDIRIDGEMPPIEPPFKAAELNWQMRIMDIINLSPFLTRQIYFNPKIFYPLRKVVRIVRQYC